MIYEYFSILLGTIKILLYKILNISKVKFNSIPKMNLSFKIAVKRNSKILFGKDFRCRNNVSFRCYEGGTINIGNNVFMNDGCSINCQQNITIGDNVVFGQNVLIFDHDHDYKNDMNRFIKEDVTIGNNVWIGANVIILKGVTIEDNCVIAAGTTITKNVEKDSLIFQEKKIINHKLN